MTSESESSAGRQRLAKENEELRLRLQEAEETLEALRSGAVDALVVHREDGHRIYSLEGAERPYRLFVEAMQQGAATLQADGTIVWCNRQFADLLKVPAEKLTGLRMEQFVAAETLTVYRNVLWQAQTRSGRGEAQILRADGTTVPVFLTCSALPPDCGASIGMLVSDITTQRHHEQLTVAHAALREREAQSSLVRQVARIGTFEWNIVTGVNTWDTSLEAMYGLPPGGFPGTQDAWEELLHPDDRDAAVLGVTRALETGGPVEGEWRVVWPDGSVHWLVGRAAVFRDVTGRPVKLYGVNIDITGIKEAEEALRANERQLALVANAAPVFIAHCDTERRYKFVNEPYARRFGLTARECEGRRIPEVVGAEAYDAFRCYVDRVLAGEVVEFEVSIPYEVSGRRFMHASYAPERGRDGKVVGFVAAITDISALKEAEEALRLSDMRKSAILTSALDCLITMDHEGRITDFNPAAERTFGYRREEVLGRTVAETIIPPSWREAHRRALSRFLATGESRVLGRRIELTALRADGSEFPCELAVTASQLNDTPPFFTAYVRDISQRRDAELALRASEARAREAAAAADAARVSAERARVRAEEAIRAKDDFLAALSHELRTPLNPALLQATALADDASLPPDVSAGLAAIVRGISLQVRLVDDLLDLTRITGGKLRLEFQSVDAREALTQSLEMVENEIQERGITVHRDFMAAEHHLHADPVRLQQIFWNVIKNAVKFTSPGGSITLRTRSAAESPGFLIVEITDTGIGIEPDMLERIFETFAQEQHSTQHRFGGLGLGLAITRQLVEMHHGRIRAISQGRGHGATFRLNLPLAPGSASPASSPATETPRAPARRILLVEDHNMTRETLTRLLERRGHTVFPAATAKRARALAAEHRCDLVISDLGLPDGHGNDLMAMLRDQHGLSGIAMSGYGADEDLHRSRQSGFHAHLVKPVDIRALDTAIAAVPFADP